MPSPPWPALLCYQVRCRARWGAGPECCRQQGEGPTLFLKTRPLITFVGLLIMLGCAWLAASQSQGLACLCLPSIRMTSVYHYTWLLKLYINWLCVLGGTYVQVRYNLQELVFFFHYVGSSGQTQVTRFGSKYITAESSCWPYILHIIWGSNPGPQASAEK